MLSEQIIVTTSPTSIRQLIATARNTEVENIPEKCTGIMLRYNKDDTKIVSITDGNLGDKPGSVTGAVVLDAATEVLVAASLTQFNISQPLLSCNSDTVTIHIIVTQHL